MAVAKRLDQLRCIDASVHLREGMQEWVRSHKRSTMGVLATCAEEACFTRIKYEVLDYHVHWSRAADFAPGAYVHVAYSGDNEGFGDYSVWVNHDDVHRGEDYNGFELESETVAAFAKAWGTTKEIAQSFVLAAVEAIVRKCG